MQRKMFSGFVGVAVLVTASISSAVSLETDARCQPAKEIASGQYSLCRLQAEARALRKGQEPDYTKCDDQLAKRWNRAEERATKAGAMCPTNLDLTAMRAMLLDHANTVADALGGAGVPACGNDVIDTVGEHCDGSDLGEISCTDLGFSGGSLACGEGCTFDTSGCTQSETTFGNLLVGTPCNGTDYGGGCTAAETGYHYKGAYDGYQCWWHTKNQAWNTSTATNYYSLATHFGLDPNSGVASWCHEFGSTPDPYGYDSNYNESSNVGAWGWCGGAPFASGGFVCFPPYLD